VFHLVLDERHSHLASRGLGLPDRYEAELLAEEIGTHGGPLRVVRQLVDVDLLDRADLVAVAVDELAAVPLVGVSHPGHLSSKHSDTPNRFAPAPDAMPGMVLLTAG
jgi:hypothetical protein